MQLRHVAVVEERLLPIEGCLEFKPSTVVAVRVRRSAVRINVGETAVRVRIVAAARHNPAYVGTIHLSGGKITQSDEKNKQRTPKKSSTCFHFGRVSSRKRLSLYAFSSTSTLNDNAPEGKPSTAAAVRARRSAVRINVGETAVRVRIVAAARHNPAC